MVFQKHDFQDVPGPQLRAARLRREEIVHLIGERAIAQRVRALLEARGALASPSAAQDRMCHAWPPGRPIER